MKKIYSLLVLSLFVGLQCFGQRYIKLYQDDVVIKQLSTEEIDSISITETEPHIVNFWYDGKIFLNYNAAGIDSITVTNNGKPPLTYAGIVAFNSELKTKDLNFLAPSSKSSYTSFIDSLTTKNGTILYYAFDNGLNMLENANIETPLESVHVITFTDGLDQGSLMLTDKYGSSVEYLNALRNRIAQTKVSGLSPQFYSVGLRGSDVSNVALFRQNLRGLASSNANAFEVTSINEIGSKFNDIAEQIQNVSTRQSMTFKVPGVESGTRMRFVFDNKAAENSQLYIEGTFNLQDRSLHNIVYKGIKAVSGKTVQGTQDGIFLTYTFTGMHRETGTSLIPTSSVEHYYKYPSSTSWQYNSEFSGTTSSQKNVSHTGTVILLIIDCSSSLTNDNLSLIKQYAKEFLNLIANNAEPFELLAPQNVKATVDYDRLVTHVSWDAVENAQSYRVYRSSSSNGTYTLLADGVTTNSWTDESPLKGYNYYKVSAINIGIESTLSNIVYAICSELEYVDLGLPSGLKWATFNVGASKPEEYGDYFFFEGETDAAQVIWGGLWRVPTSAEFQELIDNTSSEWVINYNGTGVSGRLFTANNGKSIFLPAAGTRYFSITAPVSDAGSSGYYWSRTPYYADNPSSYYTYYLNFNSVDVNVKYCFRGTTFPVRPVRP